MIDIGLVGKIVGEPCKLVPLGKDMLEGWWYKDQVTGFAYRMTEKEGCVVVAEKRKSSHISNYTPYVLMTEEQKYKRRKNKVKLVIITCEWCGALREIVAWDAKGVTLCKDCKKEQLKKRDRDRKRRYKLEEKLYEKDK